ncbi:class III extradiol ring-cleavage dioxygenase [Oceaniserpentilla sp. 4NH20-0058]|uniref:DODA-type extradiol aromatic ring-opening family dioxygenase n=1 Tax=Oceaniserpentilla sp. 4NH20-0058 TaxID=3127660 RepID=UPI003109D008
MMPHVKARTVFLSHGGGPMPLLGDPGHKQLITGLKSLPDKLITPKAIVVFSAHWEGETVEITAHDTPQLIYDYYGFPPEAYEIDYPIKGQSSLANSIAKHLNHHAITTHLNNNRGFDHGVFVPLKVMYPQGDIPCVQVSLLNNLDPHVHINIGKALQPLLQQDILFIGSGFSFHNLPDFFQTPTHKSKQANLAFENWLTDTCCNAHLNESQRESQLINWEQAPHARYCHPREEHLLPLHICYGLNQAPCQEHISVTVLNKLASTFIW